MRIKNITAKVLKETKKRIGIENFPLYLKNTENLPRWTEREIEILAWSIAWEGYIGMQRRKSGFRPSIIVAATDFDLMDNLYNIAKIGIYRTLKRVTKAGKPIKEWSVWRTLEVYYLLMHVKDYLPVERKKKIAELIIEFIESRIDAGIMKKASSWIPISERETKIYEQVRKIIKGK